MCRTHTDVNDVNDDTSVWTKLLNRECGKDGNDGIDPKMKQTETPTMDERTPQVDNVVPSYTEMVAAQVACMTE